MTIEVNRFVRFVARVRTIDGYQYEEDSGTVVAVYNGGHQFVVADRRVVREQVTGRLNGEPLTVTRYEDRNPRRYEVLQLVTV